MTTEELLKVLSDHKKWLDNEQGGIRADLRGANLRDADLRHANLRGADLRGADLDFSCFPLWCGSFNMEVDNRLVFQLAYHICLLKCDSPEFADIREKLLPYANQSHLVTECGKIEIQ